MQRVLCNQMLARLGTHSAFGCCCVRVFLFEWCVYASQQQESFVTSPRSVRFSPGALFQLHRPELGKAALMPLLRRMGLPAFDTDVPARGWRRRWRRQGCLGTPLSPEMLLTAFLPKADSFSSQMRLFSPNLTSFNPHAHLRCHTPPPAVAATTCRRGV